MTPYSDFKASKRDIKTENKKHKTRQTPEVNALPSLAHLPKSQRSTLNLSVTETGCRPQLGAVVSQ